MTLSFWVPGHIRGKGRPRFARRGNFVKTYTDDKTASAENLVKVCAMQAFGQPQLEGPLELGIAVSVAVPASWSKKRRDAALSGLLLPIGRGDLDNMGKLVADALNGIAWKDDSQITDWYMSKRYAETPGAKVTIKVVK